MLIEIDFESLRDIRTNYIQNTYNYKLLEAQGLQNKFFNCLDDIYSVNRIDWNKLTDIYRYSDTEEIAEMMGMEWDEEKEKFF
jgi:hypothetical protein